MPARCYKVLSISFEADMGKNVAASHHTLELATAMSDLDDTEVYLITSGVANVSRGSLYHYPIGELTIDGSFLRKALAVLRRNLSLIAYSFKLSRKCSVIYERNNPMCLAGLLVRLFTRKRLVYELNSLNPEEALSAHGIDFAPIRWCVRSIFRLQMFFCNAIVVQTEELKKIVSEVYKISGEKIFVVSNGAPEITAVTKKIRQGKLEVVYVGAIDQYHSLDQMVEMFADWPEARFTVIGSGPLLAELKKNAPKNVVFTGTIEHHKIKQMLPKFDIGICHYNLEAPLFKKYGFYFCPLKLLEYSAAGLPTIMVGSSNSFVRKFEKAGVCEVVEDVARLERKLRMFSQVSSKERMTLSIAAIYIAKKLSWQEIAKKTRNICEQNLLIGGKDEG